MKRLVWGPSSAVLMTLAMSLLVSCTSQNSQNTSWLQRLGSELGIFSDRPQTEDQVVTVVKLKTPPLLATAKTENGQSKVDADQLAAILAEQEQAIKDIKTLSPEIKILFRYKMVLNGVAVVVPQQLYDRLKDIGSVNFVEKSGNFNRPVVQEQKTNPAVAREDFSLANSAKWIGAETLHAKKITGLGVKVGIIDTGIDYTHAMFGGPGTEESYKSVDPSKPSLLFPNKKVVGGVDLAGSQFNTSSPNSARHIPVPDDNPLDEAGHGTHVAGTVAGVGDGVNTYSGVAPDADLYAIKVFGSEGSTADVVVIAGLEYAADPKGLGTGEGRLDVVNLSLGSPWGAAHLMYGEAMKNLVAGGTVVVASAGNEGAVDYIVGAPSVVDEALSVAASIDNTAHNWQFSAVKFQTPTKGDLLAEATEGPVSRPITEAGAVSGKLVVAGFADQDFSAEMQDKLKGNIALITRGKVAFVDKFKRAVAAGALGVVMVQNASEAPFAMGMAATDKASAIPGIMVSQALGESLRDELAHGDVVISFQTAEKILRPERIDNITSFSSKGPRSIDGLIKPEISAPGENIVSADRGRGNLGVQMSGTSMAGPHVAGAMALLRQALPKLSAQELKSVAMGRAVSIADSKKATYPVSQQGAGRIQVDLAAEAIVVADVAALSLGEVGIESHKTLRKKFSLKNISNETLNLKLDFVAGSSFINMSGNSTVSIAAGESAPISLDFQLDTTKMIESVRELDGVVKISKGSEEVYHLPVLAVAHKISQVKTVDLAVHSTSEADSAGAAAELKLKNEGINVGEALVFNLLGKDERKSDPHNDQYLSKACDLQAAGYRILNKEVDGKVIKVLQIAAKLYEPLTTWDACELSVLIDADGDGKPDQELAGTTLGNIKGLGSPGTDRKFASILLDATKARQIRKDFEVASVAADSANKPEDKKPVEDYSPAVLDYQAMTTYQNSTVAVIEVDTTLLARSATGELSIKLATIHDSASTVEMDDYLENGLKEWKKLSIDGQSQAFKDMPEVVKVQPGEEQVVDLTKGEGSESLLVLMPQNRTVFSDVLTDGQAQVLAGKYTAQ